jgi:hypothetical protein
MNLPQSHACLLKPCHSICVWRCLHHVHSCNSQIPTSLVTSQTWHKSRLVSNKHNLYPNSPLQVWRPAIVLLQLALSFSVFSKYNDSCCSDRLVVIKDPSTFELTDPHKYFQNFTEFIWPAMANNHPNSLLQVNKSYNLLLNFRIMRPLI